MGIVRASDHSCNNAVNRGDRRTRRTAGTSDTIDAEVAARSVLAGQSTATPKTADGVVEMMRQLKIVRDTAVKPRTAAMITLKPLVVHAPPQLREALQARTDHRRLTRCAARRPGPLDTPAASVKHTLRSIARRWFTLAEEITTHDRHLTRLTTETSPSLCESFGVGANTAAEPVILCGDNPTRIRSEVAFAKLCGACPIPAASGGPLAGTACIGAATARPTPPSSEPSSSACDSTNQPATTSHAAPPMAGPRARSFDASNASLLVNSTSAL